MVSVVDPAPEAIAATDSFLDELQKYSPPASTILGEGGSKTARKALSKQIEEPVLRSKKKDLITQLQASNAGEIQRTIDEARHRRFVLIMAISVIFLCVTIAISYLARDRIALALFGNGGVCVAFVGFLKFALDQQSEDHRLSVNGKLVEVFARIVTEIDDADDLVRVSEAFGNILREASSKNNSKKVAKAAAKKLT
jgi:hypothetical protein